MAELRIMRVIPRQPNSNERMARNDQSDALRALIAGLGIHVVTAIFDTNIETVEGWLAHGPVKAEDQQRLHAAFHAFSLIEEADDAHVARAWFLGMNPQLADDSPVERLAAGDTRTVLAAAHAYVNTARWQ